MGNCKGAAGFNLDGAIHGVARNNVIFNAAKGGITLFRGDGAEASHDNLIVNNTVYDPTGSRAAIQVANGRPQQRHLSNIFVSQAAAFEVQTVTGLMHDYNLVSSYTGATASPHESAPTDAAALFVDAAGGDLRLAALTPPRAVDQGIASFGGMAAPATDVLGAPRPAGAGYDIGAYEFGSVAPPVGAQVVRAGRAVPAGREARGPPPAPPARLPAPAAAAPAARRAPSRTTSSPRRSRSCSCAGDGAEVPIKNSWSGARSGSSTTGSGRRPGRRPGTG